MELIDWQLASSQFRWDHWDGNAKYAYGIDDGNLVDSFTSHTQLERANFYEQMIQWRALASSSALKPHTILGYPSILSNVRWNGTKWKQTTTPNWNKLKWTLSNVRVYVRFFFLLLLLFFCAVPFAWASNEFNWLHLNCCTSNSIPLELNSGKRTQRWASFQHALFFCKCMQISIEKYVS